ncbi:MAG: murein biosynthesis integral membrane protein MurJ [Gammaproteobacteria bacterium]|nr:murein biosynthesis integral membrane protein MurJ [Gammaproteobacteria bacterium]
MSIRLLRSVAVIGQMTFISRVLGYIRDVLIAIFFGAGLTTDAFFIAFKIPNFFRRIFAEGAFSQAFIPVLSETRAKNGEAAVRELVAAISGILMLFVWCVVAVGVIAAPIFVMVFAPGFVGSPDKYGLTVDLLRITFPYLGFISVSALAWGILNTYGRFAIPSFSPILLNLSMIGSILYLSPQFNTPILALAIGVFSGGVFQFLLSFLGVKRLGFSLWPRLNLRHPGVKKLLKLIGPAVFGASIVQINLMLDMTLASFLKSGSISWLYMSNRIVEFPLGIFGVALATVVLPNLARKYAQNDHEGYSLMIDWALRWIVFIGAPAALALALIAGPVIGTLFGYGEMDQQDVSMCAASLSAYSFGLLGFMAIKICGPGYYARQDMRTPVKIGLVAIGINLVFNLMLIIPFGHVGLALATALAANANAYLLWRGLFKNKIYIPSRGWLGFSLRILVSITVMAVALFFAMSPIDDWGSWTIFKRIYELLFLITLGTVVYCGMLWCSGLRKADLQMGKAI